MKQIVQKKWGRLKHFVQSASDKGQDQVRKLHYSAFLACAIPTMIVFGLISIIEANYILSFLIFLSATGLAVGWIKKPVASGNAPGPFFPFGLERRTCLVLREFARLLEKNVREADLVGRVGGEEFALLLVETTEKSAIETAHHLLNEIRQAKVSHSGQEISFTASIGIARSGRKKPLKKPLTH